jgi:Putative auto-transporter adhesin, head GIN domain
MKQLLTILVCMFSLLSFAQTKQTRTVGDFSGISSATGIKVKITQGNENAVVVSSSKDELIDNLKTEVDKNGVLKIYYKNPNKLNWNKTRNVQLNAYITYKSINSLAASSGSSMESTQAVNGEALSIDVSSGAEMELEIVTTNCTINMSSGSIAKVGGNAANVKIDASSGSSFKGTNLTAETCKATVSSGADIKMEVTKKLSASASSGGSFKYKGNPEIEKKTTSSGGEVKPMDN